MFGFLKRLKFRSGYSYTHAAARTGRRVIRGSKEAFADGVELGRMLEREEKKIVRKGKQWRG